MKFKFSGELYEFIIPQNELGDALDFTPDVKTLKSILVTFTDGSIFTVARIEEDEV